MKKIDVFFVIIGFFLGILCFLSTNNFIFLGSISFVFILDYFIFMRKKFAHYFSLSQRVHTGYHFINTFLITLSIKESFDDAFENATRINNARLKNEIKELTQMTIVERVKYLKSYFNLSIYNIFLNVLDLYQDQGGNILLMSDNLIRECTRTEKTLSDTKAIGYRHMVQFIILWAMALGILLFMRFSLRDMYLSMLNQSLIPYMIFSFFLICVLSINLFVNTFTNLTVKEGIKE